MRYFALATDYDGTIARDGVVDEKTIESLLALQASGRSLILVTGRELADLQNVFDRLEIFDLVVAENGALLYDPHTKEETVLSEPISPRFVNALKRKNVEPLSQGRVIVATREPHETDMLEAIRDLGLEVQVIFNKGAVMALPGGVNKSAGLRVALGRMGLSPHNVIGVGDAENDHGFLDMCEFSAAVSNALPTVKERATHRLRRRRGGGVQELIAAVLRDDLQAWSKASSRTLHMGETPRGAVVDVRPHGHNLMFTGSSGGGKSTLTKAFVERLYDQQYQFCIVDPEGDYENFEAAVILGDRTRAPLVEEVMQVLGDPGQNAVVNLLGVPLAERPKYFNSLMADLLELRARTGRPHWLVIDEAHHVLPAHNRQSGLTLPQDMVNTVMITIEPSEVLRSALDLIDTAFVVGKDPQRTMRAFARAIGQGAPAMPRGAIESGEALTWQRGKASARRFVIALSRFEHHRHRRKYATGDLGPDRSFYFKGPEAKLDLQARNLFEFLNIARGLDDETWEYHLRKGDYSTWFREMIKDPELADRAALTERNRRLGPEDSFKRIQGAIENRYTLPAQGPSGIQDEE